MIMSDLILINHT